MLELTALRTPEAEDDDQFTVCSKDFNPAITKIADSYPWSIGWDLVANIKQAESKHSHT